MPRFSLILSFVLGLAPLLVPAPAQGQALQPPLVEGLAPGPGRPLDLDRYMGRWYVIARVPNPVERGHVGSFSEYQRQDGDGIRIDYHFRDGMNAGLQHRPLRARAQADSGYRRWRTWLYKVIPTRTEVLEVAPDYSWALVGHAGGEIAWIMAREPQMDTATYRALQERLASHGFNTDRMRRVVHEPSQRGQLGFETPRR